MNKKGFALTETLVVVVFLITIFTFIYVSIVPLIGQYENMIDSESDIDIVYKLFHIRKLLVSDGNKSVFAGDSVTNIGCSDLEYNTFCDKLMEYMDLRTDQSNNYVLVYSPNVNSTNLNSIKAINTEIGSYAEKHKSEINSRVLFLLDTKKHAVAYLFYNTLD